MADSRPSGEPLPSVRAAPGTWHRFSAASPSGEELPTSAATYGTEIADESELRLLGNLEGKRVLDLGCGAGHNAVAFARQGARVIGVDASPDQLAIARQVADEAEVRIELEQAGPAELAFIRGEGIDVAFSAFSLAEVADLDRVFRQVHRVLKPEAPLLFSLPHPAFTMFDPRADHPTQIRRRYHDQTPVTWWHGDAEVVDHPRTIASVFTSLTRANFRVDTLLEPPTPEAGPHSGRFADLQAVVPPAVIFRGRKQGI